MTMETAPMRSILFANNEALFFPRKPRELAFHCLHVSCVVATVIPHVQRSVMTRLGTHVVGIKLRSETGQIYLISQYILFSSHIDSCYILDILIFVVHLCAYNPCVDALSCI